MSLASLRITIVKNNYGVGTPLNYAQPLGSDIEQIEPKRPNCTLQKLCQTLSTGETMNNLKTICMDCEKHLKGDKLAVDISHGLCKPCLEIRQKEIKTKLII